MCFLLKVQDSLIVCVILHNIFFYYFMEKSSDCVKDVKSI